jgi:AcrR family transcriptional regulator
VYAVHLSRQTEPVAKREAMAQPVKESARRTTLKRDRVVRTALALADVGGLESLSMRKLADKLGVVPMALYKHVANKDELLDAMVDVVFEEMKFSEGPGWRNLMRARAISMRQGLLRHPWAVGLMEARTPGPANLRHHNATMACLRREANLPFRMAVHAYSIMDSYIYGFALQEKTLPFETPEESGQLAEARLEGLSSDHPSRADEYPYLAEVVTELGKSGYDYNEEFEYGLDLMLDAIEGRKKKLTASPS